MKLTERIRSRAFYTLYFKKYQQEYNSFQWQTREEQKRTQLMKLKKIVSRAIKFVPFYKKLNIEINFEDFTFEELKKFPVVDKNVMRENIKDFIALEGSGFLSHTSGSTGKPFGFKLPYESNLIEDIVAFRAWGMGKKYSYRPGEPVLVLRSYSPQNGQPLTKIDRLRNYWYLSAFHINEKNLDLYIGFIKQSGSRVLRSYPSSMYLFTLLLREKNIKLPQVSTLVTSSETLLPIYRETIETYWGLPVLDWYGQNERTVTVQQCWAGNYHNNDDYGLLELDGSNNIIATSLINTIMPFIRYKTNDKAIPLSEEVNQCPCQRSLTVPFQGVEGRVDDILITDDGTMIPTANFSTAMKKFHVLKQFQIIQDEDRTVTLKLVMDKKSRHEAKNIAAEVFQRLGNVKINVDFVDEIERDVDTGKIKVIVQRGRLERV